MIAKVALWIVLIGGLGAGGYAFVHNRPSDEVPVVAESQVQTSPESAESSGKKMSFAAFISANKGSYRCTVDQYLSDMDSEGVVYIDGNRIRGDFTTVAEGRAMDTSFLVKDGYQYVWTADLSFGMKLPVRAGETASAEGKAQGTYSWDAEQIGEYDCDPWTVDEVRFSIPTTIVFTDVSAMQR